MRRPRHTLAAAALALVGASITVGWITAGGSAGEGGAEGGAPAPAATPARGAKTSREVSAEARVALLQRANVWRALDVHTSTLTFAGLNTDQLTCRFKIADVGGTTPKFRCLLDTGEEVRVKYGNGPEVPAEAAATRLLRALGFGADQISLVRTLRCYGCPQEPFSTLRAVDVTRSESLFRRLIDYGDYQDFEWAAVERRFPATAIKSDRVEGWSFFELDSIDEAAGGAPRAHVDALRLTALLLAHWDNKAENQRLVCLDDGEGAAEGCATPFLLLQDVGATFGPSKMDLEAWERTAMWDDRARCVASMHELPFEGATFGRVTISEAGRQFFLARILALSDAQLVELFDGARFAERRGLFRPRASTADWVRVFKAKVAAISEGPPCPDGHSH